MTVTVLYPEDRQIPDLVLEQEVFGPEVRIVRAAKLSFAELDPNDCAAADGLMIMRWAVTAADLDRFPRLRCVVRMGAIRDVADKDVAPPPWVECRVGNALDLPYRDAEFDAAYGVQVIEYMTDFGKALREIHRVLRPGGRFINLATNYNSIVWHSEHPERMRRVMNAFFAHAPYVDLPAILSPALRKAGLQPIHQRAVPIINMSYTENSFSTLVAKMIAPYVVGRGAVTSEEANDWLAEFAVLEAKGEYFYSATPILTEATKLS
jgi:SAM-dependent methyltransferase